MPDTNITNVVAVMPVTDHERAVAWYTRVLGRNPDLVPDEGVAEWQLAETAFIQVGTDPKNAGHGTVVIGVNDLDSQRDFFGRSGLPLGETVEYPEIIRMAEARDPDGNTVAFVQDISGGG